MQSLLQPDRVAKVTWDAGVPATPGSHSSTSPNTCGKYVRNRLASRCLPARPAAAGGLQTVWVHPRSRGPSGNLCVCA